MALFKNSREFFFQGTPPCFEKIDPPLAEKKVDPLPWAEGACPPMVHLRTRQCCHRTGGRETRGGRESGR